MIVEKNITIPLLLTILALLSGPSQGGALCAGQEPGPEFTKGGRLGFNRGNLDRVLAPIFINKMADFHVAGAAIAVVQRGELIYERGFGYADVFSQVPVQPDRTLFRIGSVTKVLTGIAVMQMIDRGLLNLDDDVNDHLTRFKLGKNFPEPVRVRHLLTHTAGFDQLGYGRHARTRSEVKPLGEFLPDNLVRIRPPGLLSCYDTYGITLAGYLVEEISGLRYEDYLKENLFEPLGMYRSDVWVPKALDIDVARGYEFRGEWEPQRWEFLNTNPASSVNSTARDMAQLLIMLTQGGIFHDRRLLSQESTRAMLTRQYSNDPLLPGYGYTFWEDHKYGVPAFSHGGSMAGYASFLYIVPDEELGVFIACNQESSRLADEVLTSLARKFLGHISSEGTPSRPRVGDVSANRFAGTYASNMYNHTRPEQGGWLMRPFEVQTDAEGNLNFQNQKARPVGDLLFQTESGDLLVFRTDDSGKVTHLLANQEVYEKLTPADLEDYARKSQPPTIELSPEALQKYVGLYQGNEGELSIDLDGSTLRATLAGREAVLLSPSSETLFFARQGQIRLEFFFSDEEQVEQVLIRAGNWSGLLTRASPR